METQAYAESYISTSTEITYSPACLFIDRCAFGTARVLHCAIRSIRSFLCPLKGFGLRWCKFRTGDNIFGKRFGKTNMFNLNFVLADIFHSSLSEQRRTRWRQLRLSTAVEAQARGYIRCPANISFQSFPVLQLWLPAQLWAPLPVGHERQQRYLRRSR